LIRTLINYNLNRRGSKITYQVSTKEPRAKALLFFAAEESLKCRIINIKQNCTFAYPLLFQR